MHDIILKYDRQVPRYTSYPTAPHFTGDIGGQAYKAWLAELPPQPLSLYLHIPFCHKMCWYCGCYTKITNRYQPIAEYKDTLLAEIELVARHIPSDRASYPVTHIHFGGGSPNSLNAQDFGEVMDRLHARFHVSPDAEIAAEIDPRTFTQEHASMLARSGMNRISMGVQDLNPKVQEAINRVQPIEMVEECCNYLRAEGIERFNMDLIYGLPYQTREHIENSVRLISPLEPDRVSVFGYAHVPWMKKHMQMIPDDALPDARERLMLFETSKSALEAAGYMLIGLDHYVRKDDGMAKAYEERALARNFQGYTTDNAQTLIGMGASAIGKLPQGYVQNDTLLKEYKAAVAGGDFPIKRGVSVNAVDRLRRNIIEDFMCYLEVSIDEIASAHEREIAYQGLDMPDFDAEWARLEGFERQGIISRDERGRKLRLNPDARLLMRIVASEFDEYLDRTPAKPRHSQAV